MTERKFTPPTEFPAEYVDGHGNKVVILGRSNAHNKPLVGFDVDGYAHNYTEGGGYYHDYDNDIRDLHDISKRITSWHNVYDGWISPPHSRRGDTDLGRNPRDRLCVYRIERDEDGSNPEIFVEKQNE